MEKVNGNDRSLDVSPGGRQESRRRLLTPVRRSSHHQRDISSARCGGTRSRSKSLRQSFREKKFEFEQERERLRILEQDLDREREKITEAHGNRSGRSYVSTSRHHSKSRQRSRSRSPSRPRHLEHQGAKAKRRRGSREQSNDSLRGDAGASQDKRSRTPSFTVKDVIDLVHSIKHGFASQPSTSTISKNIDHKNILPNFDPSAKNQRIDIWLRKVNECATVYGWDDITTTHFAMQKLQGLAKVWYEGLNTILHTWKEWQVKLMSAFPCEQNYGQILEDMLKRKSRFGEPIEVYYYEKLALLTQCEISGKHAVDCIIHGISDRTMKSSALALCCSQPDQLLQFLMSNKESQTSDRNFGKNNSNQSNSKPNQNKSNQSQGSVFCFNCKERGHPYLRCPKPLIKCNKCNKIGHTIDNCSQYSKSDNIEGKTGAPTKTMCISSSSPNSKFIKLATVNGRTLEAFIDFGSEVTLVRESIISSLNLVHDQVPSVMKGFGNEMVRSLGNILLDIVVDGVDARVASRVVEDNLLDKPILIGQSYTEQPHILVFKNSHTLQFHQLHTEIPMVYPDASNIQLAEVRIAADVELHGPASIRARVDSEFSGCLMLGNKIVGGPNQEVVVYGGVYQVQRGNLDVLVYPFSVPCRLRKDFVASRGEKVDFVQRIVIQSPGVAEATDIQNNDREHDIQEKDVRIGDSVSKEDRQRLMSILKQFKHCFASSLKNLGCTDVTQMTIELNSQRPIVYRPYRLSHHEREKVQSMLGEMLEAGIVRESVSEYASPIILVRKKDGSFRMCVDYRMLNSATVKERYPMPIIDDEIARLSGQACFITLDLASGYYQVPISEPCKHLTAFVTPDGLYEFNRMPFGLANAPAIFQRMINKVLGSARFTHATAYMDDVLVFGKNSAECLDRLEQILKLLENANLTLNLSKCNFLHDNIDYLGYEISSSGIRPGEKKIQSVINFPRPVNIHGVRQFLGLTSYFRKFIKNFAQLASPIMQLLKKDSTWVWGPEQDNAFQVLKSKLIDRPVLAIYDHDAETELHTDASKDGVGGILLQRCKDSGFLRPIAYCSRRTSPEEKHYHSYELETLAVIRSLEKFRVYLLGREFKIVTDCSALRSTFMKRDLIPRIARWWLLLQEFNCSIEYRPGTKMAHVDALSRNPIPNDSMTDSSSLCPQVMVISSEDWLHTLQLGDSELERIKQVLEKDLDPKNLQYIKDNYIVRDNKLYKYVDGDKNNVRWAVPKGARWQICKMNHDDIGHLGLEKTLERIKSKYWFPKMSRFIKKYVSACIDCAYAKKSSCKNEGLLHPIEKVESPFHTLHIDHLGPFVRSKRGYSYLLVVVDSFTKFVFIKPVRNTNTQNVIRTLDDIFYTFRMPDRLISDRGSCFTSNLFKRYCYDKGIKHILNAVASPKSNGQVERYNRTILNSLKALNLRHDERDWDNQLGKIQWGLNNTVQKTTGRRPSEVMFGTSMNSEINPNLNEIADVTRENIDVTTIRNQVKDRIDTEQAKQKLRYDQKRRPAKIYNTGDLVKITKVTFYNDGKSKKLLPSYVGPYRVTKVLGQDRYKIASIPGFSNCTNKRTTTVAADRMLPWVHVAALQLNRSDSSESSDDNDISDA